MAEPIFILMKLDQPGFGKNKTYSVYKSIHMSLKFIVNSYFDINLKQ